MTGRRHHDDTLPNTCKPSSCPVCRASAPVPFLHVTGQDYWRCDLCEARFLDPLQHPSAEAEFAHYRHHENDPDDLRYRRFLSRLADPLLEKLTSPLFGLDYGCGPGPALASMLSHAGHKMMIYDPFFSPETTPLYQTYDFITCTEVVEHFHHPADEFDRLNRLLCPGGWLGIMTCFQTDDDRFADWHYRKDPTHVAFYRETTFRIVAAQRGWTCESPFKDIVLMQKQSDNGCDKQDRQSQPMRSSWRAASP